MRVRSTKKDIYLTCALSQCGKKYLFRRTAKGKLPSQFPFCSWRCKDIDFLGWVTEDKAIPSDVEDE